MDALQPLLQSMAEADPEFNGIYQSMHISLVSASAYQKFLNIQLKRLISMFSWIYVGSCFSVMIYTWKLISDNVKALFKGCRNNYMWRGLHIVSTHSPYTFIVSLN